MPKIVDKEEKKKQIALCAKKLILHKGIQNLTVAEVAKEARIGKGTIYEYFKNKNEIVFTLAEILMQRHTDLLRTSIQNVKTTKEKVRLFSSFFYDSQHAELREIYKQFMALNLIESDEELKKFHKESSNAYLAWFQQIIEEGIASKELKPQAKSLTFGLFMAGTGMFFHAVSTDTQDALEAEFERFCDTIFLFMEY